MRVQILLELAPEESVEVLEKIKNLELLTKSVIKRGQSEGEIPENLTQPTEMLDEIKAILIKKRLENRDSVKELINSFGANTLSEIDPGKYPELLEKAKAL